MNPKPIKQPSASFTLLNKKGGYIKAPSAPKPPKP